MITLGCAMSIRARRTAAPSGRPPLRMVRRSSRFSAGARPRWGLATPGRSKLPRCSRMASWDWVST